MGDPVVLLGVDGLAALVSVLQQDGYRVLGPSVADGAVVYTDLPTASQLPAGWSDDQQPGSYRLRRRGDERVFAHASGPTSWKPWFQPPRLVEWRVRRSDGHVVEPEAAGDGRPLALVGVHACDLAAITVQDRVLRDGAYPDPDYVERRRGAFLVAVNCSEGGATCFCASTGTGPRAEEGFDLALTELLDERRHDFLVEVGTERGTAAVGRLPVRPATAEDLEAAREVSERAAAAMGRRLPEADLRETLLTAADDPRWEEIGRRCLGCSNCTLVCPTCFCTSAEHVTDLTGEFAERHRRWDSCFTVDFSELHGGAVRTSSGARYRQWLTHKFATWWDQFGTSGCVGCGRCITWCPVGIDVTAELTAMAERTT